MSGLEYLDLGIDWDIGEWYDELPLWSGPFGLMLLEHVPLQQDMTVLDLGCGTGFPLVELAQRLGATCNVYGLDPWGSALARARRRLTALHVGNVTVVRGDGQAAPFRDGAFDLIVSNLGVNNFTDPACAFAECRRILKAQGRLALTTNLQGHMAEFYGCFEATLRSLHLEEHLDRLREHVAHRTTVEALSGLWDRAGFRVCRIERASFPMRFQGGSALLRHSFIRLAFLDGWRDVVPPENQMRVFAQLEENLNRLAQERGELRLTVPMAYVEAGKRL